MSSSELNSKLISILVTGATSQIGRFLLPLLLDAGFTVHALSRTPPTTNNQSIVWHQIDIETEALPAIQINAIIHLAPLPLLPDLLARQSEHGFKDLTHIIAFGSTSLFSKKDSSNQQERVFVQKLADAETSLANFCQVKKIAWTIFRPTLIYGCGQDKNITVIAEFIRRFKFFPLIGEATGLRQPVHSNDLAKACLTVLNNPKAFNRAYNLSGGETLSYREMIERIFEALTLPPRFIHIPLILFMALIKVAAILPRYRYLSGEMARRMNQDLNFDHEQAKHDFGYRPINFIPPQGM